MAISKALHGRDDLLQHWFSVMVHYSTVETLTGEFHSFVEIGFATLTMVAKSIGKEITIEEAKAIIAPAMQALTLYK